MGIGRGELPVDGRAHRIAALFPGRHLRDQDGFGRDTPVKTLAGQHRDLDFNHVQPTAMFGSVMELQLASNAAGLGWLKDFIQDLRFVGVEVVKHQPDRQCSWEIDIHQVAQTVGDINFGAPVGDFNVPPAGQGLEEQKQVTSPFPLVLIVVAQRLAGSSRDRLAHFTDQLVRAFIKAHHWIERVVGLLVQVKHIFHPAYKLRADRRDTEPLLQPGLGRVFFNTRLTVSCDTLSTSPNSTSRSANHCIVQTLCPSGGSLHAMAVSKAAWCPSSFGRPPGRGCSFSAYSSPPSTNRLRMRSTVARTTPTAWTISSSVWPLSASRRICARFSLRADTLPLLVLQVDQIFLGGHTGLLRLPRVCPARTLLSLIFSALDY